jgi:hypothetical protein
LIDAVSPLLLGQHLVSETTVSEVDRLLFGCCQPFVLKQRPGVSSDSLIVGFCQTFWRLISLCVFTGCGVLHFNAECSEMKLVRW